MSKIVQLGDLSRSEAERRLAIAIDIFDQILKHPLLAEMCREKGITGGNFSDGPADAKRPDQFMIGEVEQPNPDKAAKYLYLCTEKPLRIGDDPAHCLSGDIENGYDYVNGKFAGGVCATTRKGGMSCLPERGDELFQVAYFIAVGDLTFERGVRILEKSCNEFISIIYDLDLIGDQPAA